MREIRFLVRLLRTTMERVMRGAVSLATRAVFYCGLEVLTVVAVGTGFALGMSSCGTQRAATEQAAEPEREWHTCLIQGAKAVLTYEGETVSASCTLQTVRDSMVIISVMPMLGIELFRLEATPDRLVAIDKMNQQYIATDYEEINRYITPSLTWEHVQQIATNALPTDPFIGYTLGEKRVALRLTYPPKQLDVPVRMNGINLGKYERIDLRNL